jgi:predicted TIM-barrel fold metal-dependent hydrolase
VEANVNRCRVDANANPGRRTFLAAAAGMTLRTGFAQAAPIPIIDTHIHFFDTTRPQGAPFGKGNPVGPIASPSVYRKVAAPLGVVGAIEVEASPWIEDNLWVLQLSQADPMMVGVVGNLEPEKPEFHEYLGRYRRNPLFRGIRCGNLWGRNLAALVAKPEFISGIKELAAADLIMDTANPGPDLIEACVLLTDQVPNLRVMIDHLPAMEPDPNPAVRQTVEKNLRELAKRNVYVKGSMIPRQVNGQVQTDPSVYKSSLDLLWDIFGEDRVVFGSDWPNTAGNWVSYEQMLAIVRRYVDTRSRAAAEKYFWRNSIAAYKWVKRDPTQPQI